MYAHKIKPVVLLHPGLEELDLAIPERPKEPFIPDITHSIEREFGMPLLKQHRLDEDVIRLRRSSVVVYQSRYLEQIEGCKMAFLTRVSQLILKRFDQLRDLLLTDHHDFRVSKTQVSRH